MGDSDKSHLGSDDCEHDWWWQPKKERWVCMKCTRRIKHGPPDGYAGKVQGKSGTDIPIDQSVREGQGQISGVAEYDDSDYNW